MRRTGRVGLTYTRHHVSNSQPVGSCCIAQRTQLSAPDDLEEWDGEGSREALEGGYICISTADAPCFTAETNTML